MLLSGYRRGGVTFPGISCTELQRTHLNIFNYDFLHRRDFRMKPGPTETDFWESAILDNQLSNHPCTMVPTVQAGDSTGIIPDFSLETGYLDSWLSRIPDSQKSVSVVTSGKRKSRRCKKPELKIFKCKLCSSVKLTPGKVIPPLRYPLRSIPTLTRPLIYFPHLGSIQQRPSGERDAAYLQQHATGLAHASQRMTSCGIF